MREIRLMKMLNHYTVHQYLIEILGHHNSLIAISSQNNTIFQKIVSLARVVFVFSVTPLLSIRFILDYPSTFVVFIRNEEEKKLTYALTYNFFNSLSSVSLHKVAWKEKCKIKMPY